MATATKTKNRRLFQLKVNIDPGGSSEATIPVGWCPTDELTAMLVEQEIVNPQVMILVQPYNELDYGGTTATDRRYEQPTKCYVVPLAAGMQYISFSKPGNNRISAYLAYNLSGKGAWHVDAAIGAAGYDQLLAYDDTVRPGTDGELQIGTSSYSAVVMTEIHDHFDVLVPQEMFAKPPPRWLKDYLGKFFRSRDFDECHTKRRMLFFGWWFMPIWLVVGYLLRTVTLAVGAWLGLRDMHIRSFRHPLTYSTVDTVDTAQRPIWFVDKRGDALSVGRWPLNPISPVVLAFVLWVVGSIPIHHPKRPLTHWLAWGWMKCLAIAVGVHLVPLAVAALVLGVMAVMAALSGTPLKRSLDNRKLKRQEAKRLEQEVEHEARLQNLQRQLEMMSCDKTSPKVAVESLPKEKQVLKLKVQRYKTKHCRPYAG